MEVAYGSVYIVDVGLFKRERKESVVSDAGICCMGGFHFGCLELIRRRSDRGGGTLSDTTGRSIVSVTNHCMAIVADILASSAPSFAT